MPFILNTDRINPNCMCHNRELGIEVCHDCGIIYGNENDLENRRDMEDMIANSQDILDLPTMDMLTSNEQASAEEFIDDCDGGGDELPTPTINYGWKSGKTQNAKPRSRAEEEDEDDDDDEDDDVLNDRLKRITGNRRRSRNDDDDLLLVPTLDDFVRNRL